jgi:hypothetical protein
MVIKAPDTNLSVADTPRRDLSLSRMPGWAAPAAATVVTLMALAPVITVVAQRAGRAYLPLQDQAVNDLRVRDVLTFSHNTPLVGVWSGYGGFNHPGPAMLYLVAPFAWLFGNAAWTTLVGYALLQGVAIAWTGRLAYKTGGLTWTAAWMAIVALSYLVVSPHPSVLKQAWNPHVALPFFILFLLQCWVVARGDRRRLLGLAFVASFLVQTHIGYAILVAALGGWAVISLVVQLRRQGDRIGRSDLRWPGVVLGLMWFVPLVLDPIFDSPSNIQRLAHYFTAPNLPPPMGLSAALGYLAAEFRLPPPWLRGSDGITFIGGPIPSSAVWLIVPLGLVALAWWSSRRAHRRDLRLVAELLAIMLAACVVSLAVMRAAPAPYRFYWRIVAGTATFGLALTAAAEAIGRRWRVTSWAWSAVLAVTVAIGSGLFAQQIAAANGPVSPYEPVAASLLAQLHRDGQPDAPVMVVWWGNDSIGIETGLIDELSREHKPVFVDPQSGFEFGYGRTATPQQVRWILVVTENSDAYSIGSALPGARVLAVSHPLPDAQQNELVKLQRRLAAALTRDSKTKLWSDLSNPYVELMLPPMPGISPQDLHRLTQLNTAVAAHGCLCSVLEFPPDQSPIK